MDASLQITTADRIATKLAIAARDTRAMMVSMVRTFACLICAIFPMDASLQITTADRIATKLAIAARDTRAMMVSMVRTFACPAWIRAECPSTPVMCAAMRMLIAKC